MYKDTITTT